MLGPQSWMQHCRWGLTTAEQRGRIPSLALLAVLVLMQSRIQLSLLTVSQLMSSTIHSPTSSPKPFAAVFPLDLFISQPVVVQEVAPTQLQHLALGLIQPHEIPIGPCLELVQASLKVPAHPFPVSLCLSLLQKNSWQMCSTNFSLSA